MAGGLQPHVFDTASCRALGAVILGHIKMGRVAGNRWRHDPTTKPKFRQLHLLCNYLLRGQQAVAGVEDC